MFKAQEESIRKIVSSCNTDIILWLDQLPEEIEDNNERLTNLIKKQKISN